MKIYAAFAAAVMLSACSSQEEKLCRAFISESLLNPETAQFSDFKQVTDAQMASDELLGYSKKLSANLIPPEGASYYRMRVRAEGELGNKITKIKFCSVDAKKSKCACF